MWIICARVTCTRNFRCIHFLKASNADLNLLLLLLLVMERQKHSLCCTKHGRQRCRYTRGLKCSHPLLHEERHKPTPNWGCGGVQCQMCGIPYRGSLRFWAGFGTRRSTLHRILPSLISKLPYQQATFTPSAWKMLCFPAHGLHKTVVCQGKKTISG